MHPLQAPQVPPARSRWRLAWGVAAALVLALAAGVVLAERAGWPFLAGPVERYLGHRLQRPLVFVAAGSRRFELHLLGGIELRVGQLTLGNTRWARPGPLLSADDVALTLHWRDLLAIGRGVALPVQRLAARTVELDLERRADGRANWQLQGPADDAPPGPVAPPLVEIRQLTLEQGRFRFSDALSALDLTGRFASPAGAEAAGWTASAEGHLRDQPLRAQARAGSTLTAAALGDAVPEVPLTVTVEAGRSRLHFDGQVRGALAQPIWQGRFDVAGPSLAAVGQPLGLTLPTTAAFSMSGQLQHRAGWSSAKVTRATIGRSQLAGDFVYEPRHRPRPLLQGELRGTQLWLQDLGPAVGTGPPPVGAPPSPAPAAGRVLPTRRFDLPALSRMDAEVRVALDRLELGHPRLRSIRPLQARLKLSDGVLAIEDLDARLAQGRLGGRIAFDGRQDPALWTVDLSVRGLVLEQWIEQPRAASAPPYLAGRLSGGLRLDGKGRSTAELLASSNGRAWLVLSRGQVSHLALEAAGLDLAQALGVALRGDDSLPVTCGAADLTVRAGQVRPQVLLLDSRDSTVWAEGSLSLADERLDLTARVLPKDVSPLSLRAPLHVRGTLAEPKLSIDRQMLARRVVPAALLALLNPLAGLLPLLDAGGGDEARGAIEACRRVTASHGGGGT